MISSVVESHNNKKTPREMPIQFQAKRRRVMNYQLHKNKNIKQKQKHKTTTTTSTDKYGRTRPLQ